MVETKLDPDVALSNQFRIELAGDTCVCIVDGNNRRGGNARGRGRSNFRIRWTNLTGMLCRLKFYGWTVKDNGDPDVVALWPFVDPSQPDNNSRNELDIQASGGGGNPGVRQVTLDAFAERVIIKYDVVVNPGSPVAELDPMIVVER